MENLYFANYSYKFLTYRNQEIYHCLQFEYKEGNSLSIFEIWLNINNVMAFKRLYSLCLKKKTAPFSLLLCFIIIISGVPLKLIRILIFLCKRKGSLKDNFLEFFYIEYNSIMDKKIELINKKVYLNCSTRVDILYKIINFNKTKSPKEICKIYRRLVETSFNAKWKNDKRVTEFNLGVLETEEGIKVKKQHWSHVSNEKLNGEKIRLVTHATSLMPTILTDTQFSGIAIRNLIKSGSTDPGTILTVGNFRYKPLSAAGPRYIPSWQFEYAKYSVFRVIGGYTDDNAFLKEELELAKILGTSEHDTEVRKFAAGHYNLVLLTDSAAFNEESVLADITQIKEEWI